MASVKLSTKPVGSMIKLHCNGSLRDFIVIHQGKPSQMYDDSCDGTWILLNEMFESRQWNADFNDDYAGSVIHSYLNSEFLQLFSSDVRGYFKQVKIPYRVGANINSGGSGLACKAFLLSASEIGWAPADVADRHKIIVDGTRLGYFLAGTSSGANAKRVANLNGAADAWATRTPDKGFSGAAIAVLKEGVPHGMYYCKSNAGVRPAMVLSPDLYVTDDGTVVANGAPSIPGTITVSGTIMTGKPLTAKWGKSTDPDGDAVTYELERAVNGGSFTRVYTGGALTHTETAGADWDTVQYRVRAADNKGATGGYVSSPVYSVIHNADPTISGTDADVGVVTAPPSHSYQVDDADAGDTLTIVEQLDGKAVRTIGNATRGTPYTFSLTRGQFFSLANGQHRMSVTVTDSKGGTASRGVTFSRNVAGIDFDVNPRETDARPEQIIVNLRCVADENDVEIKVCNNALDASPAWEPASPGIKHLFANTAKTAAKWAVAVRIRVGKSAGFEQVVCYAPSCAFK